MRSRAGTTRAFREVARNDVGCTDRFERQPREDGVSQWRSYVSVDGTVRVWHDHANGLSVEVEARTDEDGVVHGVCLDCAESTVIDRPEADSPRILAGGAGPGEQAK
jgi:hypothetical protein